MASSIRRDGLNLIFDADDTLWDSNIHFLEAEAAFLETLGGVGVIDQTRIRATLRRHELSIIETHGYGRRPYTIALQRVIAELAPAQMRDSTLKDVALIAERLLSRPCELLPDVKTTLAELTRRHRLLLFTKGQPDEQMLKLEKSGLRPLFSRIGFPKEKDALAYRLLVAQAELDPTATVMIGNSPRSDINPALKAGLRAVYIPYPHTWDLEQEELEPTDGRLITLTHFHHLLGVF